MFSRSCELGNKVWRSREEGEREFLIGRGVVAENVVHGVVQSITSEDELLICNWLPFVNVFIRNSRIFSESIVDLHGDVVGQKSEMVKIR